MQEMTWDTKLAEEIGAGEPKVVPLAPSSAASSVR